MEKNKIKKFIKPAIIVFSILVLLVVGLSFFDSEKKDEFAIIGGKKVSLRALTKQINQSAENLDKITAKMKKETQGFWENADSKPLLVKFNRALNSSISAITMYKSNRNNHEYLKWAAESWDRASDFHREYLRLENDPVAFQNQVNAYGKDKWEKDSKKIDRWINAFRGVHEDVFDYLEKNK